MKKRGLLLSVTLLLSCPLVLGTSAAQKRAKKRAKKERDAQQRQAVEQQRAQDDSWKNLRPLGEDDTAQDNQEATTSTANDTVLVDAPTLPPVQQAGRLGVLAYLNPLYWFGVTHKQPTDVELKTVNPRDNKAPCDDDTTSDSFEKIDTQDAQQEINDDEWTEFQCAETPEVK